MSSDSEGRSSSKKKSQDRSRSRSRDRRNYQARDKKVKIKIPDLTGDLYSIKQFSLLQTQKMNPDTIQKGYDKYRKDWQKKQHEDFIKKCINDAWFNQKYNPELLDLFEKQKRELSIRNYNTFLTKLESGYYDGIDLRAYDLNQIGTIYQQQEDEEINNTSNSFITNQTIQVVIDHTFNITKRPFFGFDPDSCTLFIKGLSKQISKYDIKAAVQKINGWRNITMSDPSKKTNFSRNCWIQFDNEQNCLKAQQLMSGLIIKKQALNVSKAYTKIKRVKILKNYPSTRLQTDIETIIKLVNKLDAQIGISENQIILKKYQTLQNKYDILLLYLRKIHYFDYYTCTQYQNQRVLTLKVGSAFLRTEANYEELPNLQTVFKKIQENAQKKIQTISEGPDHLTVLREQIQKYIRQSEKVSKDAVKQIWKCQMCDKKFKTCEFLAKHMIARHEDVKAKKIQNVMEQLYLKDPSKITNYYIRDQNKMKKNFGGGFRRQKRRQIYRDFDEPQGEVSSKPVGKPMINFLDI